VFSRGTTTANAESAAATGKVRESLVARPIPRGNISSNPVDRPPARARESWHD
jgi:hypothetical protein